jgi:hypothetical protein
VTLVLAGWLGVEAELALAPKASVPRTAAATAERESFLAFMCFLD